MNNNYELGKVIVALNINITSKDVLDYYIDLVLDGIDYEKAEIIFHSKNTESLNEGTNIVLIYLKDKNPDRKSTRLNSSHSGESRMPSSA